MTWGVLNTKPGKPPAQPSPPPRDYTTVGPKTYESYPSRTITILSIVQLLCGLTCTALGIVRLYVRESDRVRYEVGICEGAFFVVAGVIGIISAVPKTRGLIISAAVSSATSCVLALFVGIGWLAYDVLRRGCHGSFKGRHWDDDHSGEEDDDDRHHMHPGKRPFHGERHRSDSWLRRQRDKDVPAHTPPGPRPQSEDTPVLDERFLTLRVVDWIQLFLFVAVIVCGVLVVAKALQALKKKRRDSTATDTQEAQVFVITAEKGAVIS